MSSSRSKDAALKPKNGSAPRSGLAGLKRNYSKPDAELEMGGEAENGKGKEIIDLRSSEDEDDDGPDVKKQKTSSSVFQRSSSSSSSSTASKPATSRSLPSMFTKTANQLRADNKGKSKSISAGDIRGGPSAVDNFANNKGKGLSKVFLSIEQRRVLDCVVEQKKNVFFTGSAGTGKSVLLREIIASLRRKYSSSPDVVAVTASTGIAACNIGGVTLHSFSGIGLGLEDASLLIQKIRKNKKASGRWMRTKVLIIDEISMVEPNLFDKLEQCARTLRKKPDTPFGGLQVIITGDFFQLPPVMKGETKFAFQAKMWDEVMDYKFNLTQVFRQKDPTFVNMLNKMRFGNLDAECIAQFRKIMRAPKTDGFAPTELFARREDVEAANQRRMAALTGEIWSHTASDTGEANILKNFMAPANVTLKKGAQVMLIKNLDETLVNGSIGTVKGFYTAQEVAAMQHNIDINADSIYQEGKDADALMKVASTSKEEDVKPDIKPDVNAIAKKPQKTYPLVRFIAPQSGGFREFHCVPESWKNEQPDGTVVASRSQVPLVLSWAMSIHKAQGQTLPYCRVNLSRIFEKGQAYVALSRATSLEGLQIIGFDASKVQAHPTVVEYYRKLTTINSNADSSSSEAF